MKLWLLLAACGELTPHEFVIGDEITAHVLHGEEGFGRSVAIAGPRLVATDELQIGNWEDGNLDATEFGSARTVGHDGTEFWAWMVNGDVVRVTDGEVIARASDASGVDRCPDGTVVEVSGPGEAVSCSDAGVLLSRCVDRGCTVHIDEGVELDSVSPGGALAWVGDVACWGDPRLDQEEARGRVACSDGFEMRGMPGDHLGLSIGAGMAAGRFNRHIVPPRLRIISLSGGDTWLIDRAAENGRVSLHGDTDKVVVGVPRFRQGDTDGRVYIVGRP